MINAMAAICVQAIPEEISGNSIHKYKINCDEYVLGFIGLNSKTTDTFG